MGRPYAAELLELDATYEWCSNAPVGDLTKSIARVASHSLICVGSGGSLTSAYYAAYLHERITGHTAQTVTPYELVSGTQFLGDTSILICSAGGSNPDVIAAADNSIQRSPRHLFAVTTKPNSGLQKRLQEASWPLCHAFETPTKKDGFLATNSLLATIVLLTRAYENWAGAKPSLPPTLATLLHAGTSREAFIAEVRGRLKALLGQFTTVVLHGASTKPAAMDLESRFTEAALANVQPADYRNFAHGRHHWLARYGDTSAVIAFAELGDDIARKTLALVPKSIPKLQVTVQTGLPGAVAAVCHTLFIALIAGESKGFDPGRPHVPTFGRRLYHLRAMPRLYPDQHQAADRIHLAIERKARVPVTSLALRGELDRWRQHYEAFVERLAAARIWAIIVDYDGTLCGPESRLAGPSDLLIDRLSILLEAGIFVGVATGRGKSVRKQLLKSFKLPAARSRIVVGYHNGGETGQLDDATYPPTEPPLSSELEVIARALTESSVVSRNATIQAKGQQIALELLPFGDAAAVLAEASRFVSEHSGSDRANVVTSCHSVDVIASGVSKSNVVRYLGNKLGLQNEGTTTMLCIGDRGRAPGNDADLLSHPLSLSVDEVSADPTTCWSLAAPGLRYELACLEYLNRLKPGKFGARFDTKGLRP